MKGKMPTGERQDFILDLLKKAENPLTGSEIAKMTNVSRQIIVQDISILKAKKEPIMATSQGYIFLHENKGRPFEQMTIVCNHTPEETEKELNIIVDHGVSVKDVIIEHPVYGDLTASIRVSNRKEVDQFIQKIKETNSSYLLTLTDGIHLHTLEADSYDKLDAACRELQKAGFLVT
mgnify:FL=1